MLSAVVLSGALAAGAPLPAAALLWLALVRPVWFLAAMAGWALWNHRGRLRGRRSGPDAEAAALRVVASELAAGASLRGSLVAAAPTEGIDLSRVARLAAAGRPMDEIVGAVSEALPVNGRRAAAALHLAGRTGAAPRRVLEQLAGQAAALGALARERRAMTAQARMSAALVGSAPLVLLMVLAVTGRLAGLFGDPAGRVMLTIGVTLLTAGIGAVGVIVARADR